MFKRKKEWVENINNSFQQVFIITKLKSENPDPQESPYVELFIGHFTTVNLESHRSIQF